jgi:hypothetical protein
MEPVYHFSINGLRKEIEMLSQKDFEGLFRRAMETDVFALNTRRNETDLIYPIIKDIGTQRTPFLLYMRPLDRSRSLPANEELEFLNGCTSMHETKIGSFQAKGTVPFFTVDNRKLSCTFYTTEDEKRMIISSIQKIKKYTK